ncbi:SGNH/GDSL hydrolase family protein [Thalassobius sp. I31.1]|uniref:SGNH/GDSL hydrolase family protein n=1 Tax=Thalassobius sp. I31.1 TaxID=2109912 RepID=UPI000D1C0F13|nr:SGNH/GDSL hydrolase family protein [Thalassobius sp. I31.1]
MNVAYEPEITEKIDAAHAHAQEGAMEIAVQEFSLTRSSVLHLADAAALADRIASEKAAYARERERFRAGIAPKTDGTRKVLIMADSLGLPRPDDPDGTVLTYSKLIDQTYSDLSVDSFCQRFFTTKDVRDALAADPDLGRDSHFILHVGLNDCANRMFLEPERIALGLLTPATRNKIIDFSRKYRRQIILDLPPHHYVPLAQFRENLDVIVHLLRARNVGKIILSSIILPPARSWPGTPGINRNFALYNMEIMHAVHDHGALLLDMDRHIWQAQNRGVLNADGMHLAEGGHDLFCKKCDPYLR